MSLTPKYTFSDLRNFERGQPKIHFRISKKIGWSYLRDLFNSKRLRSWRNASFMSFFCIKNVSDFLKKMHIYFVATISVQSKKEALNFLRQGVRGSDLLRVIRYSGTPDPFWFKWLRETGGMSGYVSRVRRRTTKPRSHSACELRAPQILSRSFSATSFATVRRDNRGGSPRRRSPFGRGLSLQ